MMQRMHIVISPECASLIRGWAGAEDRTISAQLGWLIKAEARRRGVTLKSSERTTEKSNAGSTHPDL